jgi:hypothetical protein
MCANGTGQQVAQLGGDSYMMMMTNTDGSDSLHVGSSAVYTFVLIKLQCTWECPWALSLSECNLCEAERTPLCVTGNKGVRRHSSTVTSWKPRPCRLLHNVCRNSPKVNARNRDIWETANVPCEIGVSHGFCVVRCDALQPGSNLSTFRRIIWIPSSE